VDLFPVAFLPEDHALAIAIMSYNGGLDFGLLGDFDALPDIDTVAEGIADSVAELLAVVRDEKSPGRRPRKAPAASRPVANGRAAPGEGSSPAKGESPARILPEAHARPTRGPSADMRAKRQRARHSGRKRSES
jgi:hypothetical protein